MVIFSEVSFIGEILPLKHYFLELGGNCRYWGLLRFSR
jgi:hypothetical protein